jgi:peptidoglycan/LPS O-acetylase OafA/YrhL
MQPPKPAAHPNHIPALDGLRGIAIIMVIIWHYLPVTQSFFPGWAGVDLFFVLSGYLITWRLTASLQQPHYFSRFYRNRILRIFPLYYIVVIGFLLAIHFFVQPKNLPTFDTYTNHWKSFLIFTENWTFVFYGFPLNLSLGPLWSIAVEEQFYLVWPALILLLPGKRSRTTILLLLIVGIMLTRSCWYLEHSSIPRLYYNAFFRMDSFVVGALLYELHDAKIKIAANQTAWIMLGLLAIFLLHTPIPHMPVPGDPFLMTAGYTILAFFFACALDLAARREKNAFSGFLSGKFLRETGKISYCLYLIHFPILQFMSSRLHAYGLSHWPGHEILFGYIAVFTALAISVWLSLLSYRYLESWFLQYKAPGSVRP